MADYAAFEAEEAEKKKKRLAALAVEEGMKEYIEYANIVGDADGGTLLSPEEYAVFKQRAIEARKHRLYVSWRCVKSGIDCHLVGPATRCFCNHSYKSHATDNWQDKNVHCRAKGCKCKLYEYIPVHGTFRIKCSCKHFFDEHGVLGRHRCKHPGCECEAFYSPMSCSCGEKWDQHVTVIESREERMALGKPVDNIGGGGEGYEALGGITGFSSLVDGVERLDTSGIGGVLQAPPPATVPEVAGDEISDHTAEVAPAPQARGANAIGGSNPFPAKPVVHRSPRSVSSCARAQAPPSTTAGDTGASQQKAEKRKVLQQVNALKQQQHHHQKK